MSTPYINKEVNHHAGSLQRLVGCSNEFKAMVICGCAASIKKSKGLKKGLKIKGLKIVGVLRWSQVVKNLPGVGMKISAGVKNLSYQP